METWKADLKAAKIAYKDAQDRIRGFHSMRVTLGTQLERLGVPRAVRHWIMRHVDPSVSYTAYVDRVALDAWEWVNKLPSYPRPKALAAAKIGLGRPTARTAKRSSPSENVTKNVTKRGAQRTVGPFTSVH